MRTDNKIRRLMSSSIHQRPSSLSPHHWPFLLWLPKAFCSFEFGNQENVGEGEYNKTYINLSANALWKSSSAWKYTFCANQLISCFMLKWNLCLDSGVWLEDAADALVLHEVAWSHAGKNSVVKLWLPQTTG